MFCFENRTNVICGGPVVQSRSGLLVIFLRRLGILYPGILKVFCLGSGEEFEAWGIPGVSVVVPAALAVLGALVAFRLHLEIYSANAFCHSNRPAEN
jgi:hypothetical protein